MNNRLKSICTLIIPSYGLVGLLFLYIGVKQISESLFQDTELLNNDIYIIIIGLSITLSAILFMLIPIFIKTMAEQKNEK